MAKRTENEQLVEAYLTQVKESTRSTVQAGLKQFGDWLSARDVKHFGDVTAAHLHIYRAHLQERYPMSTTIRNKQSTIQRFYRYLEEIGEVRTSPAPEGWLVSVPHRVTEEDILSEDEVHALIDHARFLDAKLAIALAGLDGVKAQYITELKVEDVRHLGGRTAVVIPRRQTTQTVEVHAVTASLLADTLKLRQADEYLVFPRKQRRDVLGSIRRQIRTAQKRAGIDGRIHLRSLQKSFARNVAAHGNLLDVVASRFGANSNYIQALLPNYGEGTEGQSLVDAAVTESNALELLRQARALCEEGDRVSPIAPIVIVGAALEMVLRGVCERANCLPEKRKGLDSYRNALYRAGLISKLTHSRIDPIAKLRNSAAHGTDRDDVTLENARSMIETAALVLAQVESVPRPALNID